MYLRDRLCHFVKSLEEVEAVPFYYIDPSDADIRVEKARVDVAHDIASALRSLMNDKDYV